MSLWSVTDNSANHPSVFRLVNTQTNKSSIHAVNVTHVRYKHVPFFFFFLLPSIGLPCKHVLFVQPKCGCGAQLIRSAFNHTCTHMHAHMQLTSKGLALVATSHRGAPVIDSYLLEMTMTAQCVEHTPLYTYITWNDQVLHVVDASKAVLLLNVSTSAPHMTVENRNTFSKSFYK